MNGQDSRAEIFDVFLCHNGEDKPAVREIAQKLKKEGIKPWLDEEQIRPGTSWQTTLGEQIESINSAAVFVGDAGLGPWQNQETQALLNQFVKRGCPVIPVILASVKTTPDLPWPLVNLHRVDFRTDSQPLMQLIWGISGKMPTLSTDHDAVPAPGATPPSPSSIAGARIFICYRRDDSSGHAGRLFDALAKRFAEDHIFMDVAGIEPGADFVDEIEKSVSSCNVLLAVIGRNWLTRRGSKRKRRLDDPNDYVRLEILAGLKRDIRIIPILVQGAEMPAADSLPEDIRKLTRKQGFDLRDSRWSNDVGALISSIERIRSSRLLMS
jgi:hypothetical protein